VNNTFISALTGVIFGAGLLLSGMTDANKVINFLDVGGAWDASLGFVMVGAICVNAVLYRLVLRRESPLFAANFRIPTRSDIDARLVGGAALFGLGWGLGGYCPGPGFVSIAGADPAPAVFLASMLAGMLVVKVGDQAGTPEPVSPVTQ